MLPGVGHGDADVVALMVDAAKGIDEDVERILEKLAGDRARRLLVLNKIDRVEDKTKLLELAAELNKRAAVRARFHDSRRSTATATAELKSYLASVVPEGPWHYPEDEISDAPLRLLAAEITREKIYKRLHDELPYSATVETTAWQEFKNGSVRIEQTIFVERDSQKSIVLGKGGATIKRISSEARHELTGVLERPVHLFLFVKVREGWGSDPERYREMGLDFPKD